MQPLVQLLLWLIVDLVLLILLIAFVFVFFIPYMRLITIWIQTRASGSPIMMLDLIGMKLRKVDLRAIVDSHVRAVNADLRIPIGNLQKHYMAGGRVPQVIAALVAAKSANIDLTWHKASAIDLANQDIFDELQIPGNPKNVAPPPHARKKY